MFVLPHFNARRSQWLLISLWLAACAETPVQAPLASPPESPPPAVEKQALPASQPLKHLAGRKIAPQPTRPLNVRSQCSTRDAIGTRTQLKLQVSNADVKAFVAEVAIAQHGVCRFNIKNFEQKERLPQVLLAARDGSNCTVRMWEQGPRVTIAFNQCPAACEGETFHYLWPIMVDTKTGRCF